MLLDEKTPDGNICWSHAAVLLLISLYRQFEEKNAFSSGTSRKQAVWKAIAIEMNKHGYPYVSEQCDKKWRSLKYRYDVLVCCQIDLCLGHFWMPRIKDNSLPKRGESLNFRMYDLIKKIG